MYQHRCTVPFWDASHPTHNFPSSTKDFEAFVRWRIPTQTTQTQPRLWLTSEDLRLFFLFGGFVSAGVKIQQISRELTYPI